MTWFKFLLVFTGGGLGSLSRYFILTLFNPANTKLPLATFISNAASCLIMGISYKYFKLNESQYWILFFIMTGFCGGMSTFSTFTAENFQLIQQSNYILFSTYVLLSVMICLIFFWLGYNV
jgi:CrcB protein